MFLPDDKTRLAKVAKDIIDQCRVSQSARSALYRSYNAWIETGRAENSGRAWANFLYSHVDRLQSYLFSPTSLRFDIDFEQHYQSDILAKAGTISRVVTRMWERQDIDVTFGAGVNEALKFGASIMKQKGGHSDGTVTVTADLVPPWQFAVLREDLNGLEDQDAFVQTTPMDLNQVWTRIAALPDAENLYRRIQTHAQKGGGDDANQSFFHQIVSTNPLGVPPNSSPTRPGGIIQLSTAQTGGVLGPQLGVDLVLFHELWVKDDATGDYATIQMIEPDILVAPSPLMKRKNLFCDKTHPFTLIQPNFQSNYFWGRSEIADLVALQDLLDTGVGDIRRLIGQQFDKLLAFSGVDGITDDMYDQFRSNGFLNMGQGGSVSDLTPQLPAQAFEYIDLVKKMMDMISGFDNIMSGRGETGVRSGDQTAQLAKFASPRLRDRALLVERQAARAADTTLAYLEAKEGKVYWVNAEDEKSDFLISLLPDDRRVTVDSHSSSPIYEEDHAQLILAGIKAGYITGESAIELLPYPHKDTLLKRLKVKEQAQDELIKQHPELLLKGKH